MDWDSRESSVFKSDIDNVAKYPATTADTLPTVIATIVQNRQLHHEWKDDSSIKAWLTSVANARTLSDKNGLYVILGARAPANTAYAKQSPQILRRLPWTKTTFNQIISDFLVKNSIIRTLNRPASVFSRTFFKHEKSKNSLISYHLRDYTEASSDIGMSVTTDPGNSLTYVVVFGCLPTNPPIKSDSDQFITRLSGCGQSFLHPLLSPGIFVEIQRRKHVELVRSAVLRLEEYVINLSDNTLGKGHDKENAAQDGVDLWLEVSHYKVKLEAWKSQLMKVVQAVNELDELYYGNDAAGNPRDAAMLNEGKRIRERVEDIILDYEDMVRKCERVIDGTNLANGTAWNHLARQDNTQMKSIALLTMVFLPATFVATFFAMPLLKWDHDAGQKIYNPLMKWYWITAVPLTFVVVTLWYCLAARAKLPKKKDEAYTV